MPKPTEDRMNNARDQGEASGVLACAVELLAAIDRRWDGESDKKRSNAISPRQEAAMQALRVAISKTPGASQA